MEIDKNKENLLDKVRDIKSVFFALITAIILSTLYFFKELAFDSIKLNGQDSSSLASSFILSTLFYISSVIIGVIGIRLVANDLNKKEYANKFQFIIGAAIYYIALIVIPLIMLFVFLNQLSGG